MREAKMQEPAIEEEDKRRKEVNNRGCKGK